MFGPTSSYEGNRSDNLTRHKGDASRMVTPWLAAVIADVFAAAISWGQAQSKDLLPRYMMYAAIVGAICSVLFGFACLAGFYFLHKYDNYHERAKAKGKQMKHVQHPIALWPRLILMGLGVAAAITNGSYVYMLAFVVNDKENDYCTTFSQGTNKDKCDSSVTVIVIYCLLLTMLVLVGGYYEDVVQEACDYFNNRKAKYDPASVGGSSYGNQQGGGGLGGMDDYDGQSRTKDYGF